jgi:hypothetical protein
MGVSGFEHDHRAQRTARLVAEQRQGDEQGHGFVAHRHLHLPSDGLPLAGPQALAQLLDHVQQLGTVNDVGHLVTDHARSRRDPEVALGRRVDGADAAFRIRGDHARLDRSEHDLHVPSALLAFRVGRVDALASVAQVLGHAIERLDQESHLVVRGLRHHHVEVPAGDLGVALGQGSDRSGDALGQAQPHPHREHQGHQKGQQQLEQIGGADVARRGLKRAVLVQRLADARHAARQRERNEVVDHDGAHRFPRSE